MIYGDDLTHIVTEEGIAYLHKCRSLEERRAAIRAVAGYTKVGLKADPEETRALRADGIVKTSEDLGIDPARANRSLLAAKNVRDLVKWSGGLYQPRVNSKIGKEGDVPWHYSIWNSPMKERRVPLSRWSGSTAAWWAPATWKCS